MPGWPCTVRSWFRRAAKWLVPTVATAVIGAVAALAVPAIWQSLRAPERPVAVRLDDDPMAIDALADPPISVLVPARQPASAVISRDALCREGFRPWAVSVGGSDLDETRLRLELQGLTDSAVQVSGVTAKIIGTRPPGDAVELHCPAPGEAAHRDLALDLDEPHPRARYVRGGHPRTFGFTLARGETENFDIVAVTRRHAVVEWHLVLDLTVDGEPYTIEVTDHGRRFRTVAQGTAGASYTGSPGTADWVDEATGRTRRLPFR